MRTSEKGFTLVELLIGLVLAALFISFTIYGISTVQRNKRNTERRKVLSDIILQMSNIQGNKFKLPTNITTNDNDQDCTINFFIDNLQMPDSFTAKDFNCSLSPVASCSHENFIGEEGTDDELTLCFDNTNHQIGVKLENSPQPNIINY